MTTHLPPQVMTPDNRGVLVPCTLGYCLDSPDGLFPLSLSSDVRLPYLLSVTSTILGRPTFAADRIPCDTFACQL